MGEGVVVRPARTPEGTTHSDSVAKVLARVDEVAEISRVHRAQLSVERADG